VTARELFAGDIFVALVTMPFLAVGAVPTWATGDGTFLFASLLFGLGVGNLLLWLVRLRGGKS
jgi:hypothetical protein